jgi:hypothetical protein
VRIFLLGAKPRFSVSKAPTLADRLSQTGGNSGNQVIAHGLLAPLKFETVDWDHAKGPAYADANFDVILIAAANFLFEGFDFSGMADFISRTRLPVVMVGLGAQSNDYSTTIRLKTGTERLMRIVAERSKIIGVRGEFTGDVLNKMGIRNFQVTGCPSYYMHGSAGLLPSLPPLPRRPRIAVNGSRDVLRHAFDPHRMKRVVSDLVAQGIAYDGIFIAQTEIDEIILAETQGIGPEASAALERFSVFFRETIDIGPVFRQWAIRQMRVYWSVDDWIGAMRNLHFVIGTRIHGAIVAMLAGTPTFILAHDTRTSEMSQFFGLPHAVITDIERVDVRRLYGRIDIDAMNARRRVLLPLYCDFLNANGLKHDLQ